MKNKNECLLLPCTLANHKALLPLHHLVEIERNQSQLKYILIIEEAHNTRYIVIMGISDMYIDKLN